MILLTTDELSEYLQIHKVTTYLLLKKKIIQGFKIGGQWRFDKSIVDHWIKNGSSELVKEKK